MQRDLREKTLLAVILAGAAILLFLGWRLFWFLTDDAFIAFRYVSNSVLGYGYVWNAPPFRPVEGYTSYLWVVILDLTWRLFGVEPPSAANWISLLFSYFTLCVGVFMMVRLRWSAALRPHRPLFISLMLLGVLTNRTFLAWTSSGMETAMFNFWITLWVCSILFVPSSSPWRMFIVSLSAACIYLTRPDGLLFVAGALLLYGLEFGVDDLLSTPRRWIGMSPLIAVPVHLAWRKMFYGEWLPNTWQAKATYIWPESGMLYLFSFVMEYALWVWLAVWMGCVYRWWRRPGPRLRLQPGALPSFKMVADFFRDRPGALTLAVTAGTLLAHFAYYTLIIGGDHFEYRVYSHVVPFVFITFLWMLNRLNLKPGKAVVVSVTFILLSYPIPWTHWALSQDIKIPWTHRPLSQGTKPREMTWHTKFPVAPAWPAPFRWYARSFDEAQSWLTDHLVCIRREVHKGFYLSMKEDLPTRAEGLRMPNDGYPIIALPCVGQVSWVLPKVNVLDLLGLNDYVAARTPVDPTYSKVPRRMAHERGAPRAYVDALAPNVVLGETSTEKITIHPRSKPLTADDIRAIEQRWWQWAREHQLRSSSEYGTGSLFFSAPQQERRF